MKTQLIKLLEYNIIISDEEIREDNLAINLHDYDNPLVFTADKQFFDVGLEAQKIIASDNPGHNVYDIDWNGLEKRFGIVDVEKLADIYSFNRWEDEDLLRESKFSFTEGFKKAQSLNDKKFSQEDVLIAIGLAKKFDKTRDEIIQSIQQPQVFDINIEMNYWKDSKIYDQPDKLLKTPNPKITDGKVKILK